MKNDYFASGFRAIKNSDYFRSGFRAFGAGALVFAVMSSSAFAQNVATNSADNAKANVTATGRPRAPAIMLADKPDMLAKIEKVCGAGYKLSDKARDVCSSHNLKLTSKGNLRNQGVGGEFTALIRQGEEK